MHKTRDIPTQIEQRVQLDGALVAAELRPRKQRQAQVDGRGVEGVGRLLQGHAKVVVEIERPSPSDEHGGQVGIDVPIAHLVGLGQRVARDRGAEAGVVQFGLHGTQTGLDVAQALAIRQLGEGHAEELVVAGEGVYAMCPAVPGDAPLERTPWD